MVSDIWIAEKRITSRVLSDYEKKLRLWHGGMHGGRKLSDTHCFETHVPGDLFNNIVV